ncbi:MAG TPA: hypothetical protein DCZ97_04850 [Syntrophus sp. (in: bacteria)]|nr:hypothetical protein [Syntrophus sp. (in: bacteria)]
MISEVFRCGKEERSVNKVVVLNPIGRSNVKSFELSARLKGFHGKKIGFIDNMKPNAGPFLERVGELLRSMFNDIEITKFRKTLTTNMPIAAELEGKVDAVVNVWGD